MVEYPILYVEYIDSYWPGSSGAFLAGEKIKLLNIFYTLRKPFKLYQKILTKLTMLINLPSIPSVSSVGTMVMFLLLD